MPSEQKTITINPSLFSGGGGGGSGSGSGSGSGGGGRGRPRKNASNSTMKKQPRTRPNVSGQTATSLRKNLLAKIKEHQKKEQVASKKQTINLAEKPDKPLQNSGKHNTTFDDEFTRSLAYLSALAKSREQKQLNQKNDLRKKSRFRQKLILGNQTQPQSQPQTQTQPHPNPQLNQRPFMSQPHPQMKLQPQPQIKFDRPNPNINTGLFQHSNGPKSLKSSSYYSSSNNNTNNNGIRPNAVPEVSLEMPAEFDVPKIEVQVPVPIPASNNIVKPLLSQQTSTPFKINKDPPYGILRKGTKPTYREYMKTRKNHETSQINPSLNTSQNQSTIQKSTKFDVKQTMQNKLSINNTAPRTLLSSIISNNKIASSDIESPKDNIAKQLKERNQSGSLLKIPRQNVGDGNGNDNVNGKKRKRPRSKTMKRTTITRRFKLGKDGKKRVISVLVKNNNTRRRIKHELGALKRVPIKEVKQYLRKHNLLKVGSAAPNDVLRHLYEQSVLAGDVHNLAKDTLIHNFFNDKEE